MPILVLVWVLSFIEPDVLETMYRSIILLPICLINLLCKLGSGFGLDLRVALF